MKLSKAVIFSFLLMLLSTTTAWAQPAQHVKWNIKFEKRSATEGVVNFVAEKDGSLNVDVDIRDVLKDKSIKNDSLIVNKESNLE